MRVIDWPPVVDGALLNQTFGKVFDAVPAKSPVMIHSDIAMTGFVDAPSSGRELCEKYEAIFGKLAGERALLYPTFNYDCMGSGVYDLRRDFGKVGALSTYFSKKYPGKRTETPVFNFYIANGNDVFSFGPNDRPFGVGSTFERFVDLEGYIIVFGMQDPYKPLTILHYAETLAGIGYRYNKTIDCDIIDSAGTSRKHQFTMHFRPAGGIVEYQSPQERFAYCQDFGLNDIPIWLIDAQRYVSENVSLLRENELFWLSEKSRVEVEKQYRKYGHPMRQEHFEN